MQVYLIRNSVNGKVYVGQTKKSLRSRFRGHCYEAERGRTGCAIHKAITKYGPLAFSIESLQVCHSKDDLNTAETFWITFHNAVGELGYNLNFGGNVRDVSDATRAKMSAAALGRRHTDESKARMSRSRTGVERGPMSEEHKKNIGKANEGRERTPEFCKALSERTLPPLSDEAREKISKSLKGRIKSEETRKKLSEANIGKKASDATREKLSKAHKGVKRQPLSEETKAKIATANKKRWAEKRDPSEAHAE